MSEESEKRGQAKVGLGVGVVLIVVGILLLLGQLLGVHLGQYFWPFFVIVPGVVLFVIALSAGAQAGEGLSIVGGIVTMVGLVLLYQNTFNHFESWAYAWALVGPTSVGLSQMIYGSAKGRDDLVTSGKRVAAVGITIFLVAAAFFELVIGLSGFGLGRYGWAVLLIILGVFFLLRALLVDRRKE